MRGVTIIKKLKNFDNRFQLTRLMRGVTGTVTSYQVTVTISTHTPHARRDTVRPEMLAEHLISTHTPHARRD